MELLVVIAIIGILASVVLASLNTARAKGADAAIKSSINNSRAQAELYYDSSSSSYDPGAAGAGGGWVCSDTAIVNMSNAVNNAGGTFICSADANAYRISSILKTVTTQAFCVDSTGKSTTTLASGISGNVCP